MPSQHVWEGEGLTPSTVCSRDGFRVGGICVWLGWIPPPTERRPLVLSQRMLMALTQKSDRLCQWKSSSRAKRGFVSGMSPSADGAVEPQQLNVAWHRLHDHIPLPWWNRRRYGSSMIVDEPTCESSRKTKVSKHGARLKILPKCKGFNNPEASSVFLGPGTFFFFETGRLHCWFFPSARAILGMCTG